MCWLLISCALMDVKFLSGFSSPLMKCEWSIHISQSSYNPNIIVLFILCAIVSAVKVTNKWNLPLQNWNDLK
jgi:uncharacterized protein (DUF983 family)